MQGRVSSAAAAFLVKDDKLQSSDLEPGKYEGIHCKWLLAPLSLIILRVGSESSRCCFKNWNVFRWIQTLGVRSRPGTALV